MTRTSRFDFPRLKEEAKLASLTRRQTMPQIFVGCATCGISVGALRVAEAFESELRRLSLNAEVIRVGCLGICFAEPLVYVAKAPDFTICYKNLRPEDAVRIVSSYLIEDDPCLDLALGTLEFDAGGIAYIPELERFAREERVILRYNGIIDPEDIRDYLALDGYEALDIALGRPRKQIIDEITLSGLRGLGGAGFQAGRKWRECFLADAQPKYVICNADEGDPGAFMDRVILESSPHQVIEGMVIAGYAVGANQGYIYVRSEYPLAIERIKIALAQAREYGLLGENILGRGFDFDIKVFRGAGAFVCGESTALMYSIEGRRPMPRVRPPHSVVEGLFRKPTLLNNVKTFSCVPPILRRGGEWFATIGSDRSKGTTVFALAGKVRRAGLAEVRMGTTLREVIYEIGEGIKDDRALKAVQIGGPSGGCIPARFLDSPVDFDSLQSLGSMMGSGGLIVLDDTSCMVDLARFFLAFTQGESCGKCSFCRIGTKHLLMMLEEITKGQGTREHLALLQELSQAVAEGSLCGHGQTAPNPVLTTLRYFEDEYLAHIVEKRCPALVCRELISYYIDREKCYRGCEHCVLTCPAEAIKPDPKNIKVIDQTKCVKCNVCFAVCPREYSAVVKVSPRLETPVSKSQP